MPKIKKYSYLSQKSIDKNSKDTNIIYCGDCKKGFIKVYDACEHIKENKRRQAKENNVVIYL